MGLNGRLARIEALLASMPAAEAAAMGPEDFQELQREVCHERT